MHILYVNPNSILGTTDKILRQRGHAVFFCTTCADALELLQRQNFDAVVIEDVEENAEILDFTARAHSGNQQPLCFYLTIGDLSFRSDWKSSLSQEKYCTPPQQRPCIARQRLRS